jgi:hypothetical protein
MPTVTATLDEKSWNAFVEQHPGASGYHLTGWRPIFENVFGHRTHYLSARRGDRMVGILPLVEFRSHVFGRFAVSLPFLNQGGVVAEDDETARALVERAIEVARSGSLHHMELRHEQRRFPDLADKQHKVSMRLGLPGTADALWNALDRKVRNQIRKAEKSGLVIESGGSELVDAFYEVFAENMRDLGTPVYPRAFFAAVMERFPARTRIHVVRLDGEVIASSLTFAGVTAWKCRGRARSDDIGTSLQTTCCTGRCCRRPLPRGAGSSTSAARRPTRARTISSCSGARSRARCTGSTGWHRDRFRTRVPPTRNSRPRLRCGSGCPCG